MTATIEKPSDVSVLAQPAVRLSGVSKWFDRDGSAPVLEGIDLDVAPGEFVCLLGASGCGKTTTLRMIAGLEEPSSGTVFLGEQEVTNLPPYKRPVNTVFQSYALFPHLNVTENIAFGLRRRRIKSVKKQVDDMLELVQLGEQARKKPHQLSGGQQQRVAVARALVAAPKLILADEPTGNLDTENSNAVLGILRDLNSRFGQTILMITHNPEAAAYAHRTVTMRDGRIV